MNSTQPEAPLDRAQLGRTFDAVRAQTAALALPLSAEDMQAQSMPDASPTKWHLAHTTWFFETFALARFEERFAPFRPDFGFLFNSYYEAVGPRPVRAERGLLTRPSLDEVRAYRADVERRVRECIERAEGAALAELAKVVTLGVHHEQQHQELILTDIHHALFTSPLRPAYDARPLHEREEKAAREATPAARVRFDGGLVAIGHRTDDASFAFDNETPRHRVFLEPFAIASRAVTNDEYRDFVDDGGYRRPELWLSDGWAAARAGGWTAPLYWVKRDDTGGARDEWREHTLRGMRPLEGAAPVSHVSFYEADAYARWAGARLPTEAEWEIAARTCERTHDAKRDETRGANCADGEGVLLESGALTPRPARAGEAGSLAQMFGDVWEWTASPYVAYPRFRPLEGALGEYNGKFMCNQIVLRGGSCFTPRSHLRATYRNFFPPHARWQMSGIRLAYWE